MKRAPINIEEGYSEEEAMDSINRRSRDQSRYPMQWDSTEYFGFSEVKAWALIGNKCPHLTVENQIADENSVLFFYS